MDYSAKLDVHRLWSLEQRQSDLIEKFKMFTGLTKI